MQPTTSEMRATSAANMAGFWEWPTYKMGRRACRLENPAVSLSDAGTCSSLTRNATLLERPSESTLGDVCSKSIDFFLEDPGATFSINSHWSDIDLEPFSFEPPTQISAVMWRPPGDLTVEMPEGFSIREVVDSQLLEAWEKVFIAGFPIESLLPFHPRSLFDARVLGRPEYRLWLGYEGGEPVCVSTAYVGVGAVGVYNITTIPRARGRGYGTAITAVAARADEDKPSVLQADEDVQALYRRLGYRLVADFAYWRFRQAA